MATIDNSFKTNHTCLRVKDPQISTKFYEDNFGLKIYRTFPFPQFNFSLYMLCYNNPSSPYYNNMWADREGILELTHNYGTESDPNYTINNGNVEPHRGFGHICFSVDNIEEACNRLEKNGVKFQKKLTDGRQKDIAFALDPDGYWIELIEHGINKNIGKTDLTTYRLNHTMIRVKDPKKSLQFYKDVLGMKLFSTRVHEGAKFTLYFLGYDHDSNFVENEESKVNQAKRQSVLELTHNWGTESDPNFKGYHNGNAQPQGYGHICISMQNAEKFCNEIEEKFGDELNWSVKFNKGGLKNLAFIKDPDGYSIEIIPSWIFDGENKS
ncbi:hypothetical protein PACTADRAFT_228 [Pachysolen tannophilus NRRL Y-2460]|uniref:Lactoylglutathione lyase n=1 Tax=Pachysolen tannophilus NRRL Y-2460 TaxID=669874 RepID=A0A1E4U118_PACTA|nr:hypothetical protein PACTADRAFT_228 [Pachysolen tannophilus NRRL Y-2460]